MAKRQVISCPWQDEQGNALALGTIVFEASGDALVSGTGELCAGIKGSLTLDNTGSVAASPAQYMWPTDQMSPSNITYTVWAYSANGQLAWGPNYGLTVLSGAGSFNLCTWVPNQVGNGFGAAAGSLTLQVEGVNNAVQSLLNLESTDGSVTITDEGNGSVNFQTVSTGVLGLGTRQWWIAAAANESSGTSYNFGPGITTTNTTPTTAATTSFPQSRTLKADTIYAFYFLGTLPVDADITAQSKALLTALSTAGDGYVCPLLAVDNPTNVNDDVRSTGNNIGFFYSHASPNWQAFVTVTGTPTQIDTGVVASTAAPITAQFTVDFVGGEVTFFINGVNVGVINVLPATGTFFYIGAWGSYVSVTSDSVMNVASIYAEAY